MGGEIFNVSRAQEVFRKDAFLQSLFKQIMGNKISNKNILQRHLGRGSQPTTLGGIKLE